MRRINSECYDEVRGALLVWIQDILKDAMTYAEHGRRMTVISNDIVYALKRRGIVLCESRWRAGSARWCQSTSRAGSYFCLRVLSSSFVRSNLTSPL